MIGHVQCHNSRQNSSILSSIYSDDPVISLSFIRHIFIEIVADIDNGPERSVEIVPWGNMTKKGSGRGFSVALSRRVENLGQHVHVWPSYSYLGGWFLLIIRIGRANQFC